MALTGRRPGVVALLLLVVAGASAGPVAAHGNYLAADAQVSVDGTIRIEGVFMVTEGWVVIHADEEGALGAVIGYTKP